MSRWLAELQHVVDLTQRVKPGEAAETFHRVLDQASPEELHALVPSLEATLAAFLPKKQRQLRAALDSRLKPPEPPPPPPPRPRREPEEFGYAKQKFSADLENLSRRHIFQWATTYREVLTEYFDTVLEALHLGDRQAPWLNLVKAGLSHHATEIFEHGFAYQRGKGVDQESLLGKSLAGLQRFLQLPLEFYSGYLGEAHHRDFAQHLRELCSAMVSGILTGYARAQFGETTGAEVLPDSPEIWANTLPFHTTADLTEILDALPGHHELVVGLRESVRPLVHTLDRFLSEDSATGPLPAHSGYTTTQTKLEVSLQLAPGRLGVQRVKVCCYASPKHVTERAIERAVGEDVRAVLAPLEPDQRGWLLAKDRLGAIMVPTSDAGSAPEDRLRALLNGNGRRPASGQPRVEYNFAKDFPPDSTQLHAHFHVHRRSVQQLLSSFSRSNGVRLWCSVRRSGKTTATSLDIGTSTNDGLLVVQSCEAIDRHRQQFYREVSQALTSGARLPEDFVATAVARCQLTPSDSRVVFVLDEYETLFGDLGASMGKQPELRYHVVQPLLNQLAAFSRENLLILLGQQPDAHWIIPDQNQLSPLVIQDEFPLFPHSPSVPGADEFHQLVQKIMNSQVELDPDFVDEVHAETGGHPYLTVKLLVSFWEWLIAGRRPISCLRPVRAELFHEYTRDRLGLREVAQNRNYDMFHNFATSHLSADGHAGAPWLHSAYAALRELVLASREEFALPVDDFLQVARRCRVGRLTPESLLRTGCQANFFTLDDNVVRPRIRLLGRIAAAA